jgi:membrane protein YqaA with SNARE-associated domain
MRGKFFAGLYERVLTWSTHRHAPRYLAGLSFMESSFFPIPPDVMLIPMALRQPTQARRFALLTTVASVIGGLFGYGIGFFAHAALEPWLQTTHYWESYQRAVQWFGEWGFWVVLIAGFSPIPYKVFTVAAGALAVALLPFIVASAVGRGARFFLVAHVVAVFGPRVEPMIRKHVEWLGWGTVLAAVAAYLLLR